MQDNFFNCYTPNNDTDLDFALLKLKNKNVVFETAPYVFSSTTASQDEKSFVIGYSLTTAIGEEIKVSEGIISQKVASKEECPNISFRQRFSLEKVGAHFLTTMEM